MKRLSVLAFGVLASVAIAVALPAPVGAAARSAVARFAPVGDNGIHGFAVLRQLPDDGTSIRVIALGLEPGHAYVSLYYDNDECALEPYSADDVIGGEYTGNRGGVARTRGVADDELAEIHSVSVRDAATFDLLACAVISPGDE